MKTIALSSALVISLLLISFVAATSNLNNFSKLPLDGRDALEAGWEAPELKGLSRLLENSGETVAGRLKQHYMEETFRITSKGIGTDVIDLKKVEARELAEYAKYWEGDPLDDSAKIHKLIKMYRSKGTRTAIGNTGKWVEDVALLKKGRHIGPNEGFGWEHIVAENHHIQIRDRLQLSDADGLVKKVINEVISDKSSIIKHTPGKEIIFSKVIERGSYSKEIRVVVSDIRENLGSIVTAHPWS